MKKVMQNSNMEFNILLNGKLQRMYEENKISESDKGELRYYDEMYKKAFAFDNTVCNFENFEIYQIERAPEFLEVDKEEYSINQWAQEVCEYFFNLTK